MKAVEQTEEHMEAERKVTFEANKKLALPH